MYPRTMYPRTIWLALLVALMLAIGACTAPTAPAAPAESAAPAAEGGAAAASELSGEVSFWTAYNTVSPENETLTNEIIPAFQALHPNVTVTALALPYDELRTKLLTAVAGGLTPDLVRADIIWVPEFAEMGALAKVDELIPDFDAYQERFYPGPMATNFYQGNYYGLPLDTNTRVQVYNSALFAEAGIEAAPTTIEEFEAACAKIAALGKPDVNCYAEGGTDPWSTLPWIWSNGGALTNEDFTVASGYINGEGTVGTAAMLKRWLDDGTMSESILGGGTPTSEAIANGKVAIIIDGPWMPPIFAAQFPDFAFGMAVMPAGAGGSSSVVGGENIILFEASQNKDAALAFMQFMLEEEQQIAMGKTGQMPVLQSLTGNAELPEHFTVFMEQLATAQPRTPSPQWQKIAEATSNAFQYVLRGEQDAQAALDEAAAIVDGLLAGE